MLIYELFLNGFMIDNEIVLWWIRIH